jgi:hypothetical protein
MVDAVPITVVEMPEFLAAIGPLIDDEGRSLLVDYLAYHLRQPAI